MEQSGGDQLIQRDHLESLCKTQEQGARGRVRLAVLRVEGKRSKHCRGRTDGREGPANTWGQAHRKVTPQVIHDGSKNVASGGGGGRSPVLSLQRAGTVSVWGVRSLAGLQRLLGRPALSGAFLEYRAVDSYTKWLHFTLCNVLSRKPHQPKTSFLIMLLTFIG